MDDFSTDFFSDANDTGSDFGFDGPPQPPAPAPAPEPQPQPVVNPEEYQALQAKVQSFEKWQQEVARFSDALAGRPPQQQDDPNARLQQLLSDPNQYEQSIIEKAAAKASEQMVWDSAVNAARQSHPHLTQFEAAIHNEANVNEAVHNFYKANGRYPQPGSETVQAAISNFEQKLQGWQSYASQQQTAQNLKANALQMTATNGAPSTGGKVTAQQIAAMNPEQLERFRAQALSGSYQ